MTARRADQTRRLANHTHTKTLHKPHAAQRLAISRVRLTGTGVIERESLDVLPSAKIAPTKHVGCMAVLGCCYDAQLYFTVGTGFMFAHLAIRHELPSGSCRACSCRSHLLRFPNNSRLVHFQLSPRRQCQAKFVECLYGCQTFV